MTQMPILVGSKEWFLSLIINDSGFYPLAFYKAGLFSCNSVYTSHFTDYSSEFLLELLHTEE